MMLRMILIALVLNVGQSVLAQDGTPCPCCSEKFRQFDFWVGNWEVKDSSGNLLGHNHIRLIQDSCGLEENWTGAKGNKGTSISFYNRNLDHWHQSWIDQNGGAIEMNGDFKDGKMVLLTGKRDNPKNGKYFLNRTTWMPLEDGRVKHVWEFTKDGETTWAVVFEGYYSRVE